MLTIGLQPEYVFSVFGFLITNTFFTSIVVSCLLVVLAVFYFIYSNHENPPNIIVRSIRATIFELLKFIDITTGDRRLSKKVFPIVATFFIFIVTANLLALLPGFLGTFYIRTGAVQVPFFKSPNTDLTTTLALALFSVFAAQYFSLNILGIRKYLARFFDFSGPIKFILGLFEMLSESVRIISFSFRLFGNIFAGEILLFVVAFLVPYILPLPFMVLEVFVGIIQAFIFASLTLAFIRSSSLRFVGS
jgi:F-type H+-transporting ATPase subunit a